MNKEQAEEKYVFSILELKRENEELKKENLLLKQKVDILARMAIDE